MKKRIIALFLVLIMATSLAACGSAPAPAPAPAPSAPAAPAQSAPSAPAAPAPSAPAPSAPVEKEKIINIGMTTNMGDMHPFGASSSGKTFLRYWTLEYLAVFTEFGQPWDKMQYELAKSIKKIDDLTYDIEIFDYIYDFAGNHMTADDVIYCIDATANSGNYPTIKSALESLTKTGEYTVRLVLETPVVGIFEYILCQSSMVCEQTMKDHGDTMSQTPITTAAYQITECVQGSYYTVDKNPNYWQTDASKLSPYMKQPVDKFIVYVFSERSAASIALQKGEIDIITEVNNTEMKHFVDDKMNALDGYALGFSKSSSSATFNFNLETGSAFRDNLKLRQAILYAIDRPGIFENVVGGEKFAEFQYDIAHNDCADSNPAWKNEDYYSYNLEKAKTLIAEAGYRDGKDPATGKALHVRIMGQQSRFKDIAVVMQAQLSQIGIDVEVLVLDDTLVNTYSLEPGHWDILLQQKGNVCYVNSIYENLFALNSDGVGNMSFLDDSEMNRLLNAATDVRTHSRQSVDAMHSYVLDNAYAVGLFQIFQYSVSRAGIEQVKHPWGSLVPSASDFTEFFS